MKVIVTYRDADGHLTDYHLLRRTCSALETRGADILDVSRPYSVPADAEAVRTALLPFFAKYELSGVWLFGILQLFIESGARNARLEYDAGESLLLTRTDH